MSWRVAESLEKLKAQYLAAYPATKGKPVGFIGDAAHQTRDSDHNPWVKDGAMGVVTAGDFPSVDGSGMQLVQALVASRDPRIKYVIHNRRMWRSYDKPGIPAWSSAPYTGANAHLSHVHVSVQPEKRLYDSEAIWSVKVSMKVSMKVSTTVRVLIYNVKRGRKTRAIRRAITTLMNKHDIDVGLFQELMGHPKALTARPRFKAFHDVRTLATQNTGILVRRPSAQKARRLKVGSPGETLRMHTTAWYRWKPANKPPEQRGLHPLRWFRWMDVNGIDWLDVHQAPGGPTQKNARQQSAYREIARAIVDWANAPERKDKPVVMGGDWNYGGRRSGEYGPAWIASQIGGTVAGAGLDCFVVRGVEVVSVTNVGKYGSDHPAKVAIIRKK